MEVLSAHIPIELIVKANKFRYIQRNSLYNFYYGNSKIAQINGGICIQKVMRLETQDIQFLPYIDDKCDIHITKLNEKIFKLLLQQNLTTCNVYLKQYQLENFFLLSEKLDVLRVRKLVVNTSHGVFNDYAIPLYLFSCVELVFDVKPDSYIGSKNTTAFVVSLKDEKLSGFFTNALVIYLTDKTIINKNHELYNETTKEIIYCKDKLIDYYCYSDRFAKTKSARNGNTQ
jgi:hypothetical protein